MSPHTINPMDSGVTILFADPAQPLPSLPSLKNSDGVCVDLDLCSRQKDGSLGEDCLSFIETAEQNNLDVFLAAKAVKFYEVPGLDDLTVTLIEKPELGLTGDGLAAWIAGELTRVMGLSAEVKRGLRPGKAVGPSEPGEVNAVHLEPNLSKEQEEAFLSFVSGNISQTKAIAQPQSLSKKTAVAKTVKAKSGYVVMGGQVLRTGRVAPHGGVFAKAAKAAKAGIAKPTASPKGMRAATSGAGSRSKAKA